MLKSICLFFWNIRRIISWVSVLWNNFDWSTILLLDIMKKKLEYMEHYAIHHCTAMDAPKDAEQIREIIRLIDRVKNESAQDEAYEELDILFGSGEWIFRDRDDGLTELVGVEYNHPEYTDEQIEEIWLERTRQAQEEWKQEWHQLWTLLEKNSWGWGD